ncbi:hypothetical protein D3C72_2464290 [compost metagenome]
MKAQRGKHGSGVQKDHHVRSGGMAQTFANQQVFQREKRPYEQSWTPRPVAPREPFPASEQNASHQ